MADKTGKVVTIRLEQPADPLEEARQLAAYERAQARAAARAAEQADAAREESLRANAELFRILNEEDYRELSSTPRRRARELSLLILFQVVVGGCDWDTARLVLEDTNVSGENAVFSLSLARRAQEDSSRADEMMASCAREWDVKRFAQVDRLILWLAASELLRDTESQASIIINEAVELAKKFGTEESAAFINGMLDNIYNKYIKKKD
ncbi:MAG: transcription antitermination factor NusB [Bacillota bacterium]|nr:transcription antitermination factor NusB [Bacillota bacterium]